MENKINVIKVAAFSDGDIGGNPAGVVLNEIMPNPTEMQKIAKEVGFSETVFAEALDNKQTWRVRYFSPESEVPFCGHATIALGTVLAHEFGDGNYSLHLNKTDISVEGIRKNDRYLATLNSPQTSSRKLTKVEIEETLSLFSYDKSHLSNEIHPAHINGGADHYVIGLKDIAALSAMKYDLDKGRVFMQERNIVTVMFVVKETNQLFYARNAFASGGVFEDPATGAAAAAFSGYLRDVDWPCQGSITIIQGEDMGSRSVIMAKFDSQIGNSISISGGARFLE